MNAAARPRDAAEELARMSGDVGALGRHLLLYKSLFQPDWYEVLARHASHPEDAAVLREIRQASVAQADATLDALRAWSDTTPLTKDAPERLRTRVLSDLLHLKESTTEAFLLAGMRAPTNALRLSFVRLADLDRKHADALRRLLGVQDVRHLQRERGAERETAGAYEERGGASSFTQRVKDALEDLRRDGQEPAGLVLSAVALRHARDEGLLGPDDGTALGLPVEVDFGWRGECFCVQTRDRARLAEIIAERSTRTP